jgi:hypothetical protein
VPVYVVVGRGRFTDRVSTVFFPRDFLDLLNYVESRFNASFPNLRRLFGGSEVDPGALLEEALNLLLLLKERGGELPPAFFFAVLPKDFEDVASIIGGGASSMTVPVEGRVYELVGGFGRALLRAPEGERELKAGEELSLGTVRVKVFTRQAYEAVAGPLKTLAVAALLALRERQTVKVLGSVPGAAAA